MQIDREHLGIQSLYWLVILGLLVLVFLAVKTLFFPVLLGFLLAFLTDPVVDWLERRGWSRHSGAMILFGFMLSLVVLLATILIPMLQTQAQEISQHRGEYLHILNGRASSLRETALHYFPSELVAQAEAGARASIVEKVAALRHSLPDILTAFAHALSIGIFVPIIAFFFMVQGAEIKKWIIRLLPNRYFEMTLMMMHNVNSQLGGYLRGQAMDCIINGTLYAVGLTLLGVKGGVVIGIFAGLMNAVPYVGPVIGAIPGMFSLMLDPAATMPWWSVAVLFLGVHLVDNVVIYPATVGKSLNLPPFVVILGILFGGSIAGIPGMFLTVPLLGMARQTFCVFRESLRSYKII